MKVFKIAILTLLLIGSVHSCSVPISYESRGASGIHYYKITTSNGAHDVAAQECQDDSAHLAYFKTEEEYNNIKELVGDEEIWIGLDNPAPELCWDKNDCDGKLKWSDGTDFVLESWLEEEIVSNNPLPCFRTTLASSEGQLVNDHLCNEPRKGLCQITCVEATNPTTTVAPVETPGPPGQQTTAGPSGPPGPPPITTTVAPTTSGSSCMPIFTKWTLTTDVGNSCIEKCTLNCDKEVNLCLGVDITTGETEEFSLLDIMTCLCYKSTILQC